jgi:hypothetical protein
VEATKFAIIVVYLWNQKLYFNYSRLDSMAELHLW